MSYKKIYYENYQKIQTTIQFTQSLCDLIREEHLHILYPMVSRIELNLNEFRPFLVFRSADSLMVSRDYSYVESHHENFMSVMVDGRFMYLLPICTESKF
jgi:hypothetical protein